MKLVLLILLCFLPLFVKGQIKKSNDDLYRTYNINNTSQGNNLYLSSLQLHNYQDSVNYQFQYMRYCFKNYTREFYAGFTLEVIGYSASMAGALLINQNKGQYSSIYPMLIGAGVISVIVGSVMTIDCNKWIGRASINPFDKGFNLTIDF